MERLRHEVEVRVEHDRAVVHDPALLEVLGVAGELLTVDGHVVAAVDLGGDADLRQRGDHRAAEQAEIDGLHVARVGDEGEVEVPHIVIHGPAAGETPHHTHAVFADKLLVDLRGGVLVLTDDDGIVVLPEHEIRAVPGQAVKNVLLGGQIPRRVRGVKVQVG